MAASLAFLGQTDMDEILKDCSWKYRNTCSEFYLKDMTKIRNDIMSLDHVVVFQESGCAPVTVGSQQCLHGVFLFCVALSFKNLFHLIGDILILWVSISYSIFICLATLHHYAVSSHTGFPLERAFMKGISPICVKGKYL